MGLRQMRWTSECFLLVEGAICYRSVVPLVSALREGFAVDLDRGKDASDFPVVGRVAVSSNTEERPLPLEPSVEDSAHV